MKHTLGITSVLLGVTCAAFPQSLSISSLSSNGQMVWTNSLSNAVYRIEWSPTPTGPWRSNWASLEGLSSTNSVLTVEVPMFYRVVGSQYAWMGVANMNEARDQFAGGVIGGKLYVFSGNGNPFGQNVTTVEAYDPAQRVWITESTNAIEAIEPSSVVFSNRLYVFGITRSFGTPGISFVQSYDPVTKRWTNHTAKPTPVASAPAILYDGLIYVFGGLKEDGNYHAGVEAFNPNNNSWIIITNMPYPCEGMGHAVISNQAYFFGGTDSTNVYLDVIAFNFGSRTWTTNGIGRLSRGRKFSYGQTALPDFNGRVFLPGGAYFTNAPSGELWGVPTADMTIYDPATHNFVSGLPLPEPTSDHITLQLGEFIYVIGGKPCNDCAGMTYKQVWKIGPQ